MENLVAGIIVVGITLAFVIPVLLTYDSYSRWWDRKNSGLSTYELNCLIKKEWRRRYLEGYISFETYCDLLVLLENE